MNDQNEKRLKAAAGEAAMAASHRPANPTQEKACGAQLAAARRDFLAPQTIRENQAKNMAREGLEKA